MDWIQCNNCGVKPNQAKLFLTACGHVLCQTCTEKAKDSQCYLCKKPLKLDEINKTLRPELMELFKDPRQTAADLINELKQVATFQAKQREIFLKFKNAEAKKDNEKFVDARTKHMKLAQEIDIRKKVLVEDSARLKEAKNEKTLLTSKLKELRQRSKCLPHSMPSHHSYIRTEPPNSKSARVRPPTMNRKTSHDFPLPIHEQSTSKLVTSTPICNIDYSRRDHRNRMFGAGLETPSPIFPK